MKYDVIVVGGGIAGLTTTSYLAKRGLKVLLCEKEATLGGLVNSFAYKGFSFEGGIRSIENSGIVMPMLKELEIDIPFQRSIVSLGIEEEVIRVETKQAIQDYQNLLISKFPGEEKEIQTIIKKIEQIMKYMDILYGIDNPLFLDFKKDKDYFIHTIFPWLFKFLFTIKKIDKLQEPVENYLNEITSNQALNDIISQHFFQETPTFFALSYFSLYLDYYYPRDGVGSLIDRMVQFIEQHHGIIQTKKEIVKIDPVNRIISDQFGNQDEYLELVWAGNLKTLYDITKIDNLPTKTKTQIALYHEQLKPLRGCDSIQTTYVLVDLDPTYFKEKCSEHFFYTPVKTGLYEVNRKRNEMRKSTDFDEIITWVKEYLEKTTYEISFPVLRNPKLAPSGKTGMIISTLMDYDFVKNIRELGKYEEYKGITGDYMLEVLHKSIFPGLKEKVIESFTSTPLTIEKMTHNLDGAITGFSFTNQTIPVVHQMSKVSKAVISKIPHISQAGQWSYSPAGLPISILTGKLAANRVTKSLKKN